MWATELRSIGHQVGIQQIGKPGTPRTLEVFAADRFPVEADQALHAAVGAEMRRAFDGRNLTYRTCVVGGAKVDVGRPALASEVPPKGSY
jgi:hypothetical protein